MEVMEFKRVMSELENNGTAQNRKIYKRHGAGDNQFGVSFADLNKLKKKIKVDHALAVELWETGNSDAQSLALMIADPAEMTLKTAESWLKDVSYYMICDALAGLVSRTSFAEKAMLKWMKSPKEYVKQCGYSLCSSILLARPDALSDDLCSDLLATIEKEIHDSPNRARHSMNSALIAIGSYKPNLTEGAIEAAQRIGKVEVDHGETSCKTPDAIPYIKKTIAHLNRKK